MPGEGLFDHRRAAPPAPDDPAHRPHRLLVGADIRRARVRRVSVSIRAAGIATGSTPRVVSGKIGRTWRDGPTTVRWVIASSTTGGTGEITYASASSALVGVRGRRPREDIRRHRHRRAADQQRPRIPGRLLTGESDHRDGGHRTTTPSMISGPRPRLPGTDPGAAGEVGQRGERQPERSANGDEHRPGNRCPPLPPSVAPTLFSLQTPHRARP